MFNQKAVCAAATDQVLRSVGASGMPPSIIPRDRSMKNHREIRTKSELIGRRSRARMTKMTKLETWPANEPAMVHKEAEKTRFFIVEDDCDRLGDAGSASDLRSCPVSLTVGCYEHHAIVRMAAAQFLARAGKLGTRNKSAATKSKLRLPTPYEYHKRLTLMHPQHKRLQKRGTINLDTSACRLVPSPRAKVPIRNHSPSHLLECGIAEGSGGQHCKGGPKMEIVGSVWAVQIDRAT